MKLTDINGNSFPTTVTLNANDAFEVFANDDNGPVSCMWQLQNSGGVLQVGKGSNATTVSRYGSAYFAAFGGTPAGSYLPIVTTGPATSVEVFSAPDDMLTGSSVISVLLTATPTNGEAARSLTVLIQNSTRRF